MRVDEVSCADENERFCSGTKVPEMLTFDKGIEFALIDLYATQLAKATTKIKTKQF